MFCSSCGKSIPDFSRFCSECGSSAAGSKPAASVAVATAPASPAVAPSFAPPAVQPVQSYAAPPQTHGYTTLGTRDQYAQGNLIYPRNPPMSPHLAWFTLLIVGLPQLVYGQVAKGLVLFVLFWLSMPTVVGPMAILIAAFIDAYMVGNTLKAGRPISKWRCFPSAS